MRASLLFCCVAWLAAAEGPTLDLTATPVQVVPGATVTVELTARWPAGWQAEGFDPSLAFSGYDLIEPPRRESLGSAEGDGVRLRYSLRAPKSGPWPLPRPELTARGPDGPVTTMGPAVVIEIGSGAAPITPSPARDLIAVTPAALVLPWLLVALGAGLVVVGVFWWWYRRHPLPTISPLERLRRELLVQQGDDKTAAAALAASVRSFAGAALGFDGLGSTAQECTALARTGTTSDEHTVLAHLLDELESWRWQAESAARPLTPARQAALTWAEGLTARLTAEAQAKAAAS